MFKFVINDKVMSTIIDMFLSWEMIMQWAYYQIRKIAFAHAPGTFSKPSFGGEENVSGIPGACATRKFTCLIRGP